MRNARLLIFNIYFCVIKNSTEIIVFNKSEEMGRRQSRTLGPLFGFLLSSLFAKTSAKYYPGGSFKISYDHKPWFAYNKPSYNYHFDFDSDHYKLPSYSHWQPLTNPQNYVNYPPLTTDITPTLPYEQIINIYGHDSEKDYYHPDVLTNIETPPEFGDEFASSNTKYRRQHVNAPKRQAKPKTKNKERTRYTTSFYEDATVKRNKLRRKHRPTMKSYAKRRRITTTPYYDDDSFERTTKIRRNQNRRRRPTKNNHRQNEDENYSNEDYDNQYEYVTAEDYSSERDDDYIARQEEEETITTSTSTTTSTTTTTEPTTITIEDPTTTSPLTTTVRNATIISAGYGPPNGNDNVSITYRPPENVYNISNQYPTFTGYGPSNGNENISITYGPPTGPRYDYPSPYIDWYSHFASRNDIIKRVHDIVSFDNDYYSTFDQNVEKS